MTQESINTEKSLEESFSFVKEYKSNLALRVHEDTVHYPEDNSLPKIVFPYEDC